MGKKLTSEDRAVLEDEINRAQITAAENLEGARECFALALAIHTVLEQDDLFTPQLVTENGNASRGTPTLCLITGQNEASDSSG